MYGPSISPDTTAAVSQGPVMILFQSIIPLMGGRCHMTGPRLRCVLAPVCTPSLHTTRAARPGAPPPPHTRNSPHPQRGLAHVLPNTHIHSPPRHRLRLPILYCGVPCNVFSTFVKKPQLCYTPSPPHHTSLLSFGVPSYVSHPFGLKHPSSPS